MIATSCSRTTRAVLVAILALGLGLRLMHVSDPFIRPHEDDNARYGLAARNHLRLGLGVTRGANCLAVAGLPPLPGDFYLNHPGTLSLLIAGVYAVLGESHATTRLLPIAVSLLGMLLLFGAVRRRWGDGVALAAAGFLALTPGAVYFGRLAVFLPFLLPLGIATVDAHGRAHEENRTTWMPAFLMAAATLIDWAGLLLVPALLLAYGRRGMRRPVVAATLAGLFNLAHVSCAAGGPSALGALAAQALFRSGLGSASAAMQAMPDSFSNTRLLRALVLDHLPYVFTPIGLGAAGIGLLRVEIRRAPPERTRFLAALACWGALYIMAFREAALMHDYWVYYLLPSLAILFGLAVSFSHTSRLSTAARIASPVVAATLILLTFDQSLRILERRFWRDTHWYDHELAAVAFARTSNAAPGDIILVDPPLRSYVAAYEADRRFIHSPEISDTILLKRISAGVTMGPGY